MELTNIQPIQLVEPNSGAPTRNYSVYSREKRFIRVAWWWLLPFTNRGHVKCDNRLVAGLGIWWSWTKAYIPATGTACTSTDEMTPCLNCSICLDHACIITKERVRHFARTHDLPIDLITQKISINACNALLWEQNNLHMTHSLVLIRTCIQYISKTDMSSKLYSEQFLSTYSMSS
jgi:hypothetical protein